jgi:hypothetical protein
MEGGLDFRLKINQKHPKRPVGWPRKELVHAQACTQLDLALEMLKELGDGGYQGPGSFSFREVSLDRSDKGWYP